MTERFSTAPLPSGPSPATPGSAEDSAPAPAAAAGRAEADTVPGTTVTPQVSSARLMAAPHSEAPTELALELTPTSARGQSTVSLRRVTFASAEEASASASDDEEASPRRAEQYIGFIIDGRYHIEALIAQGGMGVVYRARHRLIDKAVAVKVLRPELADNREITQRFLTEAQAASSIGSEHIVNITDYGELPDGATYIVMEYLEGQALGHALEHAPEPLPIPQILNIMRQVCDGLQHAHNAGIIHRDLKPDNIFLTQRGKQETFVKILDFGIAKVASSQNQLTRAGRIFGTPHYMSPEQARGQELDNRSDLYSMGVILYEMISGRLPFEGENPLGILTQHMYSEPRPLHEVCVFGRINVGLEAIVSKCLLKEPWQRYSSMTELDQDLERVEQGKEPLAVEDLKRLSVAPPAFKQRLKRGVRESSGARGWIVIAVLLIGAGGALAFAGPEREALLVQWRTLVGQEETLLVGEGDSSEPQTAADGSPLHAVALVLSPIDAHVYQGTKDLGMMPITLRLREGQRVTLTVRREGYQSQTLEIDSSESRKVVELVALAGATPVAPVRALPQAKARIITFEDDNTPTEAPSPSSAPESTGSGAAPAPQEPPTPGARPPRSADDAGAAQSPAPVVEDILAPLAPEPSPSAPDLSDEGPKPPRGARPSEPDEGIPPEALPTQTWPPEPIPEHRVEEFSIP